MCFYVDTYVYTYIYSQALVIQKALLRRHEVVTISTSLQDVSVYLLAHWVLDFLQEHKHIARLVLKRLLLLVVVVIAHAAPSYT